MANRILRVRKIDEYLFKAIKNGSKKIETRAGSVLYNKIQKGDKLIFICGKSRITKKAKKVRRFKSIKSLVRVYSPNKINPKNKTLKDTEKMYYAFPNYRQRIKKFGLISIELV